MLVANGRLIAAGADPAATSVTVALGPLVPGWVGMAVLASATHLVPAIGPGDPAAHAAQRVLLGRGATTRLLASNIAIALLAVGLGPGGASWLVAMGTGLTAIALGATAALLVAAIATGIRSARASGQLRI